MNNVIKVDFAKNAAFRERDQWMKRVYSDKPWILRIVAVIFILILSMIVL